MFESVGEGFGVFGDDGAPAYARSVRSFKEVSGAEDVGKIRAGEVARAGNFECAVAASHASAMCACIADVYAEDFIHLYVPKQKKRPLPKQIREEGG